MSYCVRWILEGISGTSKDIRGLMVWGRYQVGVSIVSYGLNVFLCMLRY
jgi:hypothetical protein